MARLKIAFPYLLLAGIILVVAASNMPARRSEKNVTATTQSTCPSCGMDVDPASALAADLQGQTYYFCNAGCRDQFTGSTETTAKTTSAAHATALMDPVCHMEVNRAWGFHIDNAGKRYHFCSAKCRQRFAADPLIYLTAKCLVCDTPLADRATFPATYLGKTYALCSADHRAAFKADPAAYFMHTMWGIPSWLYYTSIAIVLIVSFGLFDFLSRTAQKQTPKKNESPRRSPIIGRDQIRGQGERLLNSPIQITATSASAALSLPIWSPTPAQSSTASPPAALNNNRFDLLSIPWISAALRSRIFRFTLQAFVAASFLLIIAAGLVGNQNPGMNIAPILTWTVWWGLLIILIMFAGKAWCYVCPWDAIAGWTEKLAFWKKTDDGLSLGLRWPRIVRNISIATILFIGLTWIELGFGVTMKPRVTAYLALGMLAMAVVAALLFDKKSFCRYGCLVGRVSGLYALFAGVEVRAKDAATCTACKSKECVKGSDTAYGCPTFLYPGKLNNNTYCIQCMECVQACPSDNLAVNLRPWGSDLANEGKPRADEAYLALLMLAITGFHGLTMTRAWHQLIDLIREGIHVGRIVGFSLAMALLMVGPIIIYAALVGVSKILADRHALRPMTYRDYFIRYAYALLPIALFYHVAHNLEHLLMEGPKVAALISDPFGWGWNLFGTAAWVIPPMISLDKLWLLQAFLVLVGHVYSLWIAQQTSLRLFGSPRAAFRSQLPMLVGMIAFSVFSLWLLKQPMEMRTSAM